MTNDAFTIRPATVGDVSMILELIRALATYERAPNEVTATESGLKEVLFGKKPSAEVFWRLKRIDRSASLFSFTISRPGSAAPDFISRICSSGPKIVERVMGGRCSFTWQRSRATAIAAEWSGRCSTGTSRRSSSIESSTRNRWMSGRCFG